ncbi:MAG TPA: sulfurtransferase [Ilumatobacteraceae bacterium]|nr:sulfurtransferase [Ilumatobacteraceae bacterium]
MSTSPRENAPIPPIVDVAWLRDRLPNDPDLIVCHVGSTMAGPDPEQVYVNRHLPGARFVSLDDTLAAPPSGTAGRHPLPTPSDFASSLAELGIGHDAPVVAYDERGGALAGRLAWMLRILGQPAALLESGITGWEAAGETIDIEPVTWEPAQRTVIDWPLEALADAIDVERHLAAGGVVIDSRDPARYVGDLEPIDPVAGHIPGAFNLLFTDNLDSDSRFLSIAELHARFAPVLGDDEQPIVYCGSGVTACHHALAMEHAGFPMPRVYVGSWSGWTADPDRPVATGPTP